MLKELMIDSKTSKPYFRDKVEIAIDRLRAFEPSEGYYLAFSGGKDSQCIYHLAQEAGVKFDAHYHLTTVDPPELVYFIRDNYPDVIVDKPEKSMWKLIIDKGMPPTRLQRYCCAELKEGGGADRICVIGVRWAESAGRRANNDVFNIRRKTKAQKMLFSDNDEGRLLFETCTAKGKRVINPIVDWSDDEVWEYIHRRNLKYCKLYDEGQRRIGCIGCPLNSRAIEELERYPKYKASYIRAFQRMVDKHGYASTSDNWTSGQAVYDWWTRKTKRDAELDGQICLGDYIDGEG